MELGAEYPTASSQQIADALIDSIESGSVISQAISHVIIPTTTELKHAELKSKRLPQKRVPKGIARKRELLIEHLENAPLFKQLKSLFILPLEDTQPGPIIGLDGARVSLLNYVQRPDTTYRQSYPQALPRSEGTRGDIPFGRYENTAAYIANSSTDSSNQNAREITFSSLDALSDIGENEDHLLSFLDIYRIIALLHLYPDDEQVLLKADEVVRNDINLRNKDSKSDCLKELYRGNDQLPLEIRIQSPKTSDIMEMTQQRIRAIILDQYQRLQSESGQRFIKAEITYDDYIHTENKYASYANELTSALL
jgi:hypothetical protein